MFTKSSFIVACLSAVAMSECRMKDKLNAALDNPTPSAASTGNNRGNGRARENIGNLSQIGAFNQQSENLNEMTIGEVVTILPPGPDVSLDNEEDNDIGRGNGNGRGRGSGKGSGLGRASGRGNGKCKKGADDSNASDADDFEDEEDLAMPTFNSLAQMSVESSGHHCQFT